MQLMLALVFAFSLSAREVETNNVFFNEAPDWVSRPRLEKIIAHIQTVLEWDIRKVTVTRYDDKAKFQAAHSLGPAMLAVSLKNSNTILIGPGVTRDNFDQVFGHELVHIISFQKYKGAIPLWLEEGLANHLAKTAKVDYKWLASRPLPKDVRAFSHPASGTSEDIHFHYTTSQAVTEMIAKKCDLTELLRLSVGEKMETYLDTYCDLPDLNAAYKKWVQSHAH